jgi:hypothetical protein
MNSQVLAEELGRVKGHFGPINTLAFFPNGTGYACFGLTVHQSWSTRHSCVTELSTLSPSIQPRLDRHHVLKNRTYWVLRFASGGEDGYVRLHEFEPSYFDFSVSH